MCEKRYRMPRSDFVPAWSVADDFKDAMKGLTNEVDMSDVDPMIPEELPHLLFIDSDSSKLFSQLMMM